MIIRERQNIIDLIRKDAYSSCIITSYSFDFIFFEERLMPALKSAGVKNVNLFLDGNYFDEQLENTIGREFQSQRTYSINTIYDKGIFHPKIIFLFGTKQALMIIGSGNISTSGMSSNDEVWGAFHINSIGSANAPLLAQCWSYLEGFFDQSLGFNYEKLQWIYKNTPWLNELSEIDPKEFTSVIKDLEATFVSNNQNGNIYEKLYQIIGKKKVDSLTIVSPYFDTDGEALINFHENYEINQINCLTDSHSGLLPYNLEERYKSNIRFFEWGDCTNGFEQKLNRLHAKIFDFKLEDGTEYLLLGSCNATINALGSLKKKALNQESAILLKRVSNYSYLEELGIRTSEIKHFSVNAPTKGSTIPTENNLSSKYRCKILHAEKDGNRIFLILDRELEDQTEIVFRDKNLIITETHQSGKSKELKIKLSYPEKAEQVFISINEDRISNIRPIQDNFMLSKSNPDSHGAEFNRLIEEISQDPDFSSIAEIFKYLDYTREEDDSNPKTFGHRNPSMIKEKMEKEYEALTEEEFNQLPAAKSYIKESINHPNVQLAELIGLLGKGMITRKEQASEDKESTSLSEEEENPEGGNTPIISSENHNLNGEKIKKAILNHIKKIHDNHFITIEKHIKNRDFKTIEGDFINLKEISNFIILLGLLNDLYKKTYEIETTEITINYHDQLNYEIKKIEKNYHLFKSEKVDRDNIKASSYYIQKDFLKDFIDDINKISPTLLIPKEESKSKIFSFPFFKNSTFERNDEDSIKTILVNTLGLFLLRVAISKGFKTYEFEVQKEKMEHLRKTLFEIATNLILRIDWLDKEIEFRNLTLLDLVHLVQPKWTSKEEILARLEVYQREKGYSFKKNLDPYHNQILKNYAAWRERYETDRNSLIEIRSKIPYNSIIFKSNLGFATIGRVSPDSVSIKKPGLWSFSDEKGYFKFKYPNEKVIVFNRS